MGDIELIREWLAKADENFDFALVNLEEGKPAKAKSAADRVRQVITRALSSFLQSGQEQLQ